MKKSVRIRKAGPGETPGYYNKTANFLKKAQMGIEVGSVSKDPARLNQIYENAYVSLKNSITPDLVYNDLITSYALDQTTALSIIKSAISQLSNEGYFDPEAIQKQEQQTQAQGDSPQNQQRLEEEEQRASDDAEDEELANSSEGYYDGEEALNNDTSHLEMEQDEQEQAFRYGGYFQEGGEEDYSEYEDFANTKSNDPRKTVIDQYSGAGNIKQKKPFSLEDLMAITPGMQNQEAFPDLSYYLGDYRPVSDSFQPQAYLPQARFGGISQLAQKYPLLTQGPGYLKPITPMTNMSAIRKMLPVATMTGQALTKLPWVGSKLTPQLKTTFTQNRDELWKLLHNDATPKPGVFSYNGSVTGGGDGSLGVDRLQLYQDDVFNIIKELNQGNGSFKLSDLGVVAETDGLVGGVYPLDSKIIGGTDDAGNNFFELTYKFGPNQKLPFGSTSSKAKELTFKNRFYYNTDPETGAPMVFDQMGNPLSQGVKTKSIVTPPVLSGLGQSYADLFLKDRSGTPFPRATDFPFRAGLKPSKDAPLQGTFSYITEQPPATWETLSTRGKVGRALETYGTTGLNQLYRTKAKNIQNVTLPTFGYVNPALGTNVLNPATEGSYANDINNALNYKYRIGRNALLGLGLAGYAGYKGYDAMYNQCQCDNEKLADGSPDPTYQPKDKYGNCPCGTDVGPIRTLDPTGVEFNKEIDQRKLTYPDSMQFLIQRGIAPTPYNYYRYSEGIENPNVNTEMPPDDFKFGGVSKSNFIKKVTAKYDDGGSSESTIGKGKRTDDLTNTVENKKNFFKTALKNNSNKAITGDIYENAKYNPKIMNLLMQDGYKENLAEDQSMQPQAEIGGFVDMDSENPLTRFVYGGIESEYYEPYGLPEAQDGINIMNQAGEQRVVGDKLDYEDWLEGETNQEDYEASNPEGDYNSWYTGFTSEENKPNREAEYKQYEDFYNKSLNEYLNYGKPETNNNCPAGYEWNGTACVLKKPAGTQTKCGPGTVWNETYKQCIPIAKVNYTPRMVRGNTSMLNVLTPWNPIMANMGTYAQPMGKPYYLGTKDAFTGKLPAEVAARYVTKKGLLGKEKEWIDIYNVSGNNPIDPSQLKNLVDPKKERREKSDRDRLDRNRSEKEERVSRRDYLDAKLQEDAWNKQHWNELSNAEKRHARQTYTFENEDERNFKDKVRFGAQGTRFYEDKSTKRIRDKKQFGGMLFRNGGFNPFELGSGFSNGVGATGAFAPYSQQQQFENELLGMDRPSSGPPPPQNPLSFVGLQGSYAETANTGHTLGSQGQEIIPEEPAPEPNQYVGVKNKRKTVRSIDPEAGVNAFNATMRGGIGLFERFKNRKTENNAILDQVAVNNIAPASTELDYGDQVDTGSGIGYRTPAEGNDRNSRATFGNYAIGRYGGYMQAGGFTDPYQEDDEVYMTPEELEQFLAAGGQVEYL
jgi:hypothetical protein